MRESESECKSVAESNGKLALGIPAAQTYYPSCFRDKQTFIQFIKKNTHQHR